MPSRFDRADLPRLLSPLAWQLIGPWSSALRARNPIVRRNLRYVVGDGRHARPRGSEKSGWVVKIDPNERRCSANDPAAGP